MADVHYLDSNAAFTSASTSPALQQGGGGGTFGGMSEVDAKIAAAEARTDTKFAQVMGELRVIEGATRGLKGTVIGTGIAVVGLVVALLGWGSQMFGAGMDTQTAADRAAQSAANAVEQRMSLEIQEAFRAFQSELQQSAVDDEVSQPARQQ